jgi:small subunit ribosomal protein S15
MGRMHIRRKGKSKSVRPSVKKSPEWFKRTPDEVESLIVKYAKSGEPSSKIGIILRDQHGIPLTKFANNQKMKNILEKNNLLPEVPEDLSNLLRRAYDLSKHLEEHPKDLHSTRGLQLIESKIRRLSNYYIKEKAIPENWKYKRGDPRLILR